jgi:uncharacterized Zn finger protein
MADKKIADGSEGLCAYEPDLTDPHEDHATFIVQGSSSEPYKIVIRFNPLAISCTCPAGVAGIPCKHRLHILNGYSNNLLSAPKNYREVLSAVNEVAGNSNVFELLDEYEATKKSAKDNDAACGKALKKYRNELTNFVLGKIKTNKKAEKANVELDDTIKKGIEIEAEKESILSALRTFFISPFG